jgi:2-polyprenyl-3-methyl-5-hydroxy-6-metoxy-1,4-benzoquinol methylase
MKRSNICPLCINKKNETKTFLKKNINNQNIGESSYSSRKVPEFMNYQLLKCDVCTFIYAINIPDLERVKNDYKNSIFVSADDADDAALTYYNKIREKINIMNFDSALEIGAGSGSFIAKLKKLGFKKITGVEPSISSIEFAKNEIKAHLINDVFETAKIEKNAYDLVCCFMTMEHVHDPLYTIKKSFEILKNDGKIILVTHNCEHLLHKFLGKKSPIIDVEHLQLFSSKSIFQILDINNFTNIEIFNLKNKYNLKYWVSLLPLPFIIKKIIIKILNCLGLHNFKLGIDVGNIMITADKKC